MLKFKSLELENYKSYESVTLPLEQQGLTLIEGHNKTNERYQSNGTGKSALLEGITYALYGKTSNNLKADEVINRNTGKDTKAQVELEKDGTSYTVSRYRNHYQHKNKVLLHRDGKDITAKSNRDTDKLIQDLVGISYDVWTNSIFYGQGDTVLFAEATDKGKKEILENITSIRVYAQAHEIAKERVKEKEKEEQDVERNIQDVEREIEHIKESVQREKDQYQQVQSLIDTRKQELEEAKRERKKFPQKQYRELQKKFEELDSYKLPAFQPDETELNQALNAQKDLQDKSQAFHKELASLEGQLLSKQQQRDSISTATTCPTCGQPVDASNATLHREELEQEIQRMRQQISTYQQQYQEVFEPALQKAEQSVSEARQEIELARQEHRQLETEYRNEHQEWQHQLQVYANKKEQLDQTIETAKRALEEVETLPKPDTREDEIKALEDQITDLKDDLDSLFIQKSKYEKTVKAFSNSGIRSMVLDLVTPTLTNSANRYLAELTDSYIQVEFTTQVENQDGTLADKFDVNVTNGGAETTYQTLSQGERTRVDVAISLALQDLVYANNQLTTNIALYDEVFDGLDNVGITSVINILEEKAKDIGSIFVITHSDTMKPLFENVITIIKETDGNSRIEKET